MVIALALLPLYFGHTRAIVVPPSDGNVPNSKYGLITGLSVDAGDIMSFSSQGVWYICPDTVACVSGPNGIPGTGIYLNTTIPFVPLGTLIGNVSNCLFVIANASSIISPCTGILQLLMNDFSYGDNLPKNLTVTFSVVGFLTLTSTTTAPAATTTTATTSTTTAATTVAVTTVPATTTSTSSSSSTTITTVPTTIVTTIVPETTTQTTTETTTTVPETTIESTTVPETTTETVTETTTVPETTTTETATETTTVPETTTETTTTVPDTTTETATVPDTTTATTTKITTVPDTTTETITETSTTVPDTTTETSTETSTAVPDTTTETSTAVPDTTTETSTAVPDTTTETSTETITETTTVPDTTTETSTTVPETTTTETSTETTTTRTTVPETTTETTTVTETTTTFTSTTLAPTTSPFLPSLDSYYNDVFYTPSTGAKYAVGYVYGPNAGYMIGGTFYLPVGTSPVSVLITKFDGNNNVEWARTAISQRASAFNGVAVSNDGSSIYAVGFIRGNSNNNFGNNVTSRGANTQDNCIMVMYNASGIAQWSRTIVSGPRRCIFLSVAVDQVDGSVYVVGTIDDILPYDFGNNVTVQAGYLSQGSFSTSAVIVKYDANGLAQWARAVGGVGGIFSRYTDVSLSPINGTVYVSGNFYTNTAPLGITTHDFGDGQSFTAQQVLNSIFGVVAYNTTTGTCLFAKTHQTPVGPPGTFYFSGFNAITSGLDGSFYAAGFIYANPYGFPNGISGQSASTSQNSSPVIVKFDAYGNAVWMRFVTGGNSYNSALYGIATNSVDGSIYAVGSVSTTTSFTFGGGGAGTGGGAAGSLTIGSGGPNFNTLIIKVDSAGAPQWGYAAAVSPDSSGFTRVAADANSNIYSSGYLYGTSGYDFGGANGTAIDQGTGTNLNRLLVKFVDPAPATTIATTTVPPTTTITSTTTSTSTTTASTTMAPTTVPVLPPLASYYADVVSNSATGAKYSVGYVYGPAGYNVGNTFYVYTPSPISVLISKFDTNDNVAWSQTAVSSPVVSAFNGVAVSNDGASVYSVGYMRGNTTVDFGNGVSVTGANSEDNVVLVKYNASTGLAQWARSIVSGSGRCIYTSVDVDPNDGSVYAVGYIYGILPYNFGNNVTVQSGYTDMGASGSSALIVKYNGTTGLAQWAQAAGGAGMIFSQYTDVSVLPDDGSVFVVGTFYSAYNPFGTDTHTFGSGISFSVRHVDASVFGLVKYDASGSPQFAKTHLTPDGYSYGSGFNAIVVGLDGYVYAGGFIAFNAYRFSNGISFSSGSAAGGSALAFVKFDVAGNAIWGFSVSGGNAPNSAVTGLSFGVDGSIYGVGSVFTFTTFYVGSVTFATGGGYINTVILKFNTNGVPQWGYASSVAYLDTAFTRTAIGSTGSVYCSGYVIGPNGYPQYNFNGNSTALDQGTYSNQNRVLVRYYVDPATVIPVIFPKPTTELIFRYVDTGYYGAATSNTTTYASGFIYGPASNPIAGLLVKFDSSDNKQWIRTATSNTVSVFNAVATSADGNSIYAAGYMRGNTSNTFGNVTLVGPNTEDNVVLVKYDIDGNVVWARTIISGAGRCVYQQVAVSNITGDIYAVGYMSGVGAYNFGNGTLVSGGYGAFGAGSNSILIVKYSPSGFAQWARTASASSGYSYLYGVTVGSDDNVYAVGRFYVYQQDLYHNLGSGVYVQPDYASSAVIIKYSKTGTTTWARQSKSQYNFGFDNRFACTAASSDGYVYAAGFYRSDNANPICFGSNCVYLYAAYQQALIVKYDLLGNAIWINGYFGGFTGGQSEFLGMTVAPSDGSIYVTGRITSGGYDFGNGVYLYGPVGNYNMILIKYGSNGTPLWGKATVSGTSYSYGVGVSLDSYNSNVYIAGVLQGLMFNWNTNITDIGLYAGNTNRFLIRYPSS